MRDDTPSRTARWVAAARGLGALLPPEGRLAEDPYGATFSSPVLANLLTRKPLRSLASKPGIGTWVIYMQVRTRVLDDAIRELIAAGGRQVVVLGAGYDTRALRLPELADAAVFEVDHPATQRHKRATLERSGVTSPARYVTWDFESRPMAELPAALAAAGHDATKPTITIWEGVTMYLTEGAIDASIRAIAGWSSPGSMLAMTYFAQSRLDKPSIVTRAVNAVISRLGEPWTWGWMPDELPGYLAERGFTLATDVSIMKAAHQLLPAGLANALTSANNHIARAVVSESVAVATRTV
ncbi:MAG: SAM-dependent methyltransferase [Kofleriaceae bacterium]